MKLYETETPMKRKKALKQSGFLMFLSLKNEFHFMKLLWNFMKLESRQKKLKMQQM